MSPIVRYAIDSNKGRVKTQAKIITKEELRRRRTALGIKQSELAELVGVSANYISQIELGNKPIAKKFSLAIVAALDNLERELVSQSKSIGATTIGGNISANGSVFAVGNGASARGVTNTGRFSEEIPVWARQIIDDLQDVKSLLLKLMAKN